LTSGSSEAPRLGACRRTWRLLRLRVSAGESPGSALTGSLRRRRAWRGSFALLHRPGKWKHHEALFKLDDGNRYRYVDPSWCAVACLTLTGRSTAAAGINDRVVLASATRMSRQAAYDAPQCSSQAHTTATVSVLGLPVADSTVACGLTGPGLESISTAPSARLVPLTSAAAPPVVSLKTQHGQHVAQGAMTSASLK
jgi:hypothetical protein